MLLLVCLSISGYAASHTVAGWGEHAVLLPENIPMRAKLDTGAQTAALYAINIVFFEKNNTDWVSFEVPLSSGEYLELEREVVRTVRIRARIEEGGGVIERPVVKFNLQLGADQYMIEVGLTDRSNLDFPLLLGRNALSTFNVLVDSSHQDLLPIPPKHPALHNAD